MRTLIPLLAAALLVPACAEEEETADEKFARQKAAIENKAAAYEAQVRNDVEAYEAKLENEADAILNAQDANGAADAAVPQ